MASGLWVIFGSISFALVIGLVFPFNWCKIVYYTSHYPRHLALALTFFQYLTFMTTATATTLIHLCFMHYWHKKRANGPKISTGPLKKTAVDMINIVIAPIMLHRFVGQLNRSTSPGDCGFYLPGWWFLLALICFTTTYHAWTHVLHVVREYDVVMDIAVGSGLQVAVYEAAKSNNYYILMAVLGFYGGFRFCGYLLYSLLSPSLVVDVTKLDLEEALIPPSLLP